MSQPNGVEKPSFDLLHYEPTLSAVCAAGAAEAGLQGGEVESAVPPRHQLPVEHDRAPELLAQRAGDLREVVGQVALLTQLPLVGTAC
jgi:hypothetical protein